MINLNNLFRLEVDDIYFALWDVADHHFFIVELPEEVNDVVVGLLKENMSIGRQVNDAFLFARLVHSDYNVCIVVGHGGPEDFRHRRFEGKCCVGLE